MLNDRLLSQSHIFLGFYENVQILKNYSFINYYPHNKGFQHHVNGLLG